jgi:hypothetical protein
MMRRIAIRSTVASLALLVGLPFLLAAQGRRGTDRGLVELPAEGLRGGFFLSGGLGRGGEQYKYSDETLGYSNTLAKPSFTLRLGGTPSQMARLGGEVFAWVAHETTAGTDIEGNPIDISTTEYFTTALGIVQLFPAPNAGFYVKGGAGLAWSGVNYSNGSNTLETGFGWNVGAGWDFQVSRAVAVGPFVDFYQGTFTKRNEATLTERVLNIGAQVTFQAGGRSWR